MTSQQVEAREGERSERVIGWFEEKGFRVESASSFRDLMISASGLRCFWKGRILVEVVEAVVEVSESESW